MAGKMVAPILIGAITVIYYVFFFLMIMLVEMPIVYKVFLGIIPFCLAGVMIAVVWSRIKEITGGEEDDLSQY